MIFILDVHAYYRRENVSSCIGNFTTFKMSKFLSLMHPIIARRGWRMQGYIQVPILRPPTPKNEENSYPSFYPMSLSHEKRLSAVAMDHVFTSAASNITVMESSGRISSVLKFRCKLYSSRTLQKTGNFFCRPCEGIAAPTASGARNVPKSFFSMNYFEICQAMRDL